MRFEICGNVEVLEDPSEFFGYPLDIRNGDVDLVFVGQWFALLCFLRLIRRFESFVEGPFLVATLGQGTSEVFMFVYFGRRGFCHCQFVFQRLFRITSLN